MLRPDRILGFLRPGRLVRVQEGGTVRKGVLRVRVNLRVRVRVRVR